MKHLSLVLITGLVEMTIRSLIDFLLIKQVINQQVAELLKSILLMIATFIFCLIALSYANKKMRERSQRMEEYMRRLDEELLAYILLLNLSQTKIIKYSQLNSSDQEKVDKAIIDIKRKYHPDRIPGYDEEAKAKQNENKATINRLETLKDTDIRAFQEEIKKLLNYEIVLESIKAAPN